MENKKLSKKEQSFSLANLHQFRHILENWSIGNIRHQNYLDAQILLNETNKLIENIPLKGEIEIIPEQINTMLECLIHTMPLEHQESIISHFHPLQPLFKEIIEIKRIKGAESYNKNNPHCLPISRFDIQIRLEPKYLPK